MASKIFCQTHRYRLISDERDIMVSNQVIADVLEWCDRTGVVAEQVITQSVTQRMFGVNLWRVRDEQQRTLFALRWS